MKTLDEARKHLLECKLETRKTEQCAYCYLAQNIIIQNDIDKMRVKHMV